MSKRVVRKSIKELINNTDINDFINNQAIEDIQEQIEKLEETCDSYGLELDIDFEEIKSGIAIQCLEQNDSYDTLKEGLNDIIEEVETWMEDLSETKQEEIQEEILDPLEEVRGELEDTEYIQCDEDIENHISIALEKLKDI